ncbi:MAG: helix-turn-helix domain-containing protein [Oliverpabstia sp.]
METLAYDKNNYKHVKDPHGKHGTDSLHYAFYDINCNGVQLGFNTHCHSEYDIVFLLNSYLDFIVDGKFYHLSPNEALFIDSNAIHGHADMYANYGRYLVFSFGSNFIFPDPQSYIYNYYFAPLQSGKYTFTKHITGQTSYEQEILDILKELSFYGNDIQNNSLPIQLALLRIYNIMFQHDAFDFAQDPISNKEYMRIALSYIKKNYTLGISVQEVARLLNISTDYFCRLFKTTLDITPKEYIQNLRIRHAISEMDKNPYCTVTEIALTSGFSDPNYFSRIFRRKTGISPSGYLKHIKNNHLDFL